MSLHDKRKKPILCLDFDGVLHSYSSGWQGADVVSDSPVPGAMEFIYEALHHFEVHIYSSRSHQDGGIKAMYEWLKEHFMGSNPLEDRDNYMELLLAEIVWPEEKPPAFLTIDDRAIQFTGTFPPARSLLSFKPWNKS